MKDPRNLIIIAALALIAALGFGWLSDHTARLRSGFMLPLEKQALLHRDDNHEICWTTHRKPGMFGRVVFQVWERPTDGEEWKPLLTLETAQDTPIGPPILKHESSGPFVTDGRGSFEFELASGALRKNNWPDSIYTGPVRCCFPPE